MANVRATIGNDHYKTVLTTNTNTLIADEPLHAEGTDLGFAPTELLASALASCTAITLRMYADRKEWPLNKVDVVVTFQRDNELNISNMSRSIELHGQLSQEQRERLLQIANLCPIHKILTNPIAIVTKLV